MRYLALLTLCFFLLPGCGETDEQTGSAQPSGDGPGGAVAVDEPAADSSLADALEQVTAETAVLLDVRTDDEWSTAHFAQARHIPLDKITGDDAEAATAELDKEKTIYVHCAAGRRAVTAANRLKELGFKAQAMETSYSDIKDAGFEEAK